MRELILLIINLTKNIELYFRFSYQGFHQPNYFKKIEK